MRPVALILYAAATPIIAAVCMFLAVWGAESMMRQAHGGTLPLSEPNRAVATGLGLPLGCLGTGFTLLAYCLVWVRAKPDDRGAFMLLVAIFGPLTTGILSFALMWLYLSVSLG